MIKYGNGQPYKCPKKTLIEWEREWNIWVPGLRVTDHFVEYDQIDAFDTMRPYNGVIKWKDNYELNNESLYENFLKHKKDICNIENNEVKNDIFNKVCSVTIREYIESNDIFNEVDNKKMALIEWEKRFNLFIPSIREESHYQVLSKEDAIELISLLHSGVVKFWNSESDKVYNRYMRKIGFSSTAELCDNPIFYLNSGDYIEYEEKVIENIPVGSFISNSISNIEKIEESILVNESTDYNTSCDQETEYIDTVIEPVINMEKEPVMYSFPKISEQFTKESSEQSMNNIYLEPVMDVDVTSKKKNIFDIFSVKKPKSKTGIKKSLLKTALAIVASFTTLVSIQAANQVGYKSDDIIDNSYSFIQDSDTVMEVSNNSIIKEDKEENKDQDVNKKSEKVNTEYGDGGSDDKDIIKIGDIVTIDDDASIYVSLDDAGKMENGLALSNDNDMLRRVEYIAVNYNDSIVYSNKQEEIDYYISNGGYEISVMTSINDYNNIGIEGSYNINDIVKESAKIKKMR